MNITLSPAAIQRINTIKNSKGKSFFLRLKISSGGCKGLSYELEFDNNKNTSDYTIQKDSDTLFATENELLQFANGAIIDFEQRLGKSGFKVINPNADSTCGCGTSFMPKAN